LRGIVVSCRRAARLPLALLPLLAAGCLEAGEEFVLNPDLSGEAVALVRSPGLHRDVLHLAALLRGTDGATAQRAWTRLKAVTGRGSGSRAEAEARHAAHAAKLRRDEKQDRRVVGP
jgi:hypothetical protein